MIYEIILHRYVEKKNFKISRVFLSSCYVKTWYLLVYFQKICLLCWKNKNKIKRFPQCSKQCSRAFLSAEGIFSKVLFEKKINNKSVKKYTILYFFSRIIVNVKYQSIFNDYFVNELRVMKSLMYKKITRL